MSYREMGKPFVLKINGEWGFLCCIGTVLPSDDLVRRSKRKNSDNPEWFASMRLAVDHYHLLHRPAKRIIADTIKGYPW